MFTTRGNLRVWIALAALAAFGSSLLSGFHFDDYGMLQDPAIARADGWLRCLNWLQTRPLTWLSFWMNAQLTVRAPFLWHAINVGLHVGNSLLLYRLLRRMLPDIATIATLIFAAHPIMSEPVDYVYARAILLATLFSILSLEAWTKGRVWVSVAWFAAAVLSKEECVALPIVLALIAWRGRIAPLLAMFGVAAAAGLRVIAAIHATGMVNIGANAGISPIAYLAAQGGAICRYLGLLIVPWAFSVDPELPAGGAWAWIALAGLIAVCFWRFQEVRAARWILAGLILLIPSSSIFPAADLAADRRMYLPMIAFAPAIGLLLPRLRAVWVVVLTLALTGLSIYRTYIWDADERLWGEAVRLAPAKTRPRIQLARAVPPASGVEVLKEAERIAPQNAEVATELARVYLEAGRLPEALAEAGRALALTPGDAHALSNRGAVLLAMRQTTAARRDFLSALRSDPCLQQARENLARSGGIPDDVPVCGRR